MLARPRTAARASAICREASGKIEIDDFARRAALGQLLGQHDEPVAGAASGDQRAEGPREIPASGEDVVVDLLQVAGRALDEAALLVGGIAQGIGKGLVLRQDRIVHSRPMARPMVSTILPVAFLSKSWRNACFVSARSKRRETSGCKRPSRHQANISAKAPGSSSGRRRR